MFVFSSPLTGLTIGYNPRSASMLAKYGFVYQPTPLVPGGALCPFDSTTISPAAQFGQMLQLQKEKLYQAGFSDEVLLADWFGYELASPHAAGAEIEPTWRQFAKVRKTPSWPRRWANFSLL